MREIKFRAWTHQNPPMPWSQKAVAITGEGEQMLPIGGTCTGVWHAFKNAADGGLIIEQYTGLKDKNGREIYEGDIVKRFKAHEPLKGVKETEVFRVRWGVKKAGFFAYSKERKKHSIPAKRLNANDVYEVIGNIHENPELLREDK